MLDQDADEALERPVERPVHDVEVVLGVVGPYVLQAEARGHLRVELDRPHLPLAPERVVHEEVDLRAVEGAFAGRDRVRDLVQAQRLLDGGFVAVPLLVGADLVVRPRRELGARLQAEQLVQVAGLLDTARDLVLDLLFGAEDVRVVLA